jgi:hypothetical protein
MTAKRTYILICLLIAYLPCRTASAEGGAISPTEYRAELDRLSSATAQLDSGDLPTPQPLHDLPQSWLIRTDRGEFDVSAEGLRRDVRRYEAEKSITTAAAVRARVQSLHRELDGFERPPADVSAQRADLKSILARPEFREVDGPTWLDRFKEWLLGFLQRALSRLFRGIAIPGVGKVFVYGLMAVAVLALAYLVCRNIVWGTDFKAVTPTDLPVSAKEWAVWLSEGRTAAAQGKWRDAIHFAYWAGISFLERDGTWKPDRARTPREYLELLSSSSDHRETLTALTRIFELAWYAKREADEKTFSKTLEALGKLGCR